MPIYKNNIIKFKNTAERWVGGRGGQRSILRRAEILATVCLSRLNQSKLRLSPSVIKLPVSRTMSDGEKGCYSGQSLEDFRDGNHKKSMDYCLALLKLFQQCNLKFYKRCFITDRLQKHFCITGWCLVSMLLMGGGGRQAT